MKILEHHVDWSPVPSLSRTLCCVGLSDEFDGLVITLALAGSNVPVLKLSFLDVVAYRNIDEGYRARTWAHMPKAMSSLRRVEHSEWIEWLRAEAGGVLDDIVLTHLAIYTEDDCIDVVSKSDPEVELLE